MASQLRPGLVQHRIAATQGLSLVQQAGSALRVLP
ncbi:MAG: hypothetical protein RLZZ415_1767, partial [Pseudomonadota bacterium]